MAVPLRAKIVMFCFYTVGHFLSSDHVQMTLHISSRFICRRILKGKKFIYLHAVEQERLKQVEWLASIHTTCKCQSQYSHLVLPNVKLGACPFWWHKFLNSLSLSRPTLKLTPMAPPSSPWQKHRCTMNSTAGKTISSTWILLLAAHFNTKSESKPLGTTVTSVNGVPSAKLLHKC